MFEAGVEVIILLLFLGGFQELLGDFGLVGGGVSIHETHVVNTVRSLRPEVSDEEILLHTPLIIQRIPIEFVLLYTHVATCVDSRVVTYVRVGEGFACKVREPIMGIVVTRRGEAPLLVVEGMADIKYRATYITMVR